jgi:hypothetical protein
MPVPACVVTDHNGGVLSPACWFGVAYAGRGRAGSQPAQDIAYFSPSAL